MLLLYPPAFLRLIEELENYQLPARRRLLDGEAMSGRINGTIAITAMAVGDMAVAPVTGMINGTISMRAVLRCRQRSIPATVKKKPAKPRSPRPPAPAKKNPVKPRSPRPPAPSKSKEPRSPRPRAPAKPKERREPKPRPKRSRALIDTIAQKARDQRARRVAAVLPLVADARAQGAVLLKDICLFLDSVGHKPPRGGRWSTGTLSAMLPGEHDRKAREAALASLITQANAEGAANHVEIAEWLKERGHRTIQDRDWTRDNVYSFIKTRTECWSADTLSLILPGEIERKARDATFVSLIAQARSEGARSNVQIAEWLNERGHRTALNVNWTRVNLHHFLVRTRSDET